MVAMPTEEYVKEIIWQFRVHTENCGLDFEVALDSLIFKNGSMMEFKSAKRIPRGGVYHKVLHNLDELSNGMVDMLYSVVRAYPEPPSSFKRFDKAVKPDEPEDTSAMEAWLSRFPVETV